ncbi:MAG: tetratricopeptide repeat protein [Chloroflexi bacterium]|nr:tetratricopeptide repeat protein [Chloroflexota bacterium]
MLQEAVEAGQSGQPERARKLLLRLLRQDNREPLYWLLMSTVVDSREERIYCLQNVLFLDPENSAAIHDLELLGAEIPKPDTPALLPEEPEDWHTKEIAAPKIPKKRKKKKEEPWSLSWIVASLGVGLVIILLGYYAAQNGFLDVLLSTETPGPSLEPSQQSGSTPTSQDEPTATQEMLVVPRDPQDLLEATYTPTPRYISTPHPGDDNFEQGLAALDNQNWDAAADFFQGHLVANPQSADAAYYLGQARLGAGDLEAAQTAFQQSLAIDPEFAPAYLGRARVAIAQGADSSLILTDLNSAILLDPNFVDAYLERAAYNLRRGNIEDANDDIKAAEAIAPLSALVQYHKALVLLAGEDYSGALQASQRAYELDLTLLPNYLTRAESQQGVQQYAASIETMQTYLTFEGENARGWELLGLGYQFDGQTDLALQAFDRALELDPNSPQAAYYRGLQELADEKAQSALGYFRVALASLPDWFEAHIGLAQAYLGTGNPSGAFFEINASSDLIETDEQRAAFFYWRATVLETLGQMQTALADWRSLLNLPASVMPVDWRQTADARVAGQ